MGYLRRYFNKVISDAHSAVIHLLLGAAVLGAGTIYALWKDWWAQIQTLMQLPTPLWVTAIFFAFFLIAYVFLRVRTSVPLSVPSSELLERFHVFWDRNYKMRCLNCGKPLKSSSSNSDPSIFYCVDPRCEAKHVLRDTTGKKITEQEALDQIKNDPHDFIQLTFRGPQK
jgi:hypothetical protein